MKTLWQRSAHQSVKRLVSLRRLLWIVLVVLGACAPVHAGDIKIVLDNRGFNTEHFVKPHILFTNAVGPVSTSLFLIPQQGETTQSTADQDNLLFLFHDPQTWKAYLRGMPKGAPDGKLQVIFQCTVNRLKLQGQNLREIKMTISDNACDVILTSGESR